MRVLADPDRPLEETVPAERPVTLRDLLTFTLGTSIVVAEPGTVPIADALGALPPSAWTAATSAGWRPPTSVTRPLAWTAAYQAIDD